MLGLFQDARYALRLLRRQPSFSIFVVLTLAIGIGANSAVFSVVNGVVLRPLPFAESERLIAIWGRFDPESGFDFPQFVLSNPEYVDYRDHSRAVGEMASSANGSAAMRVGRRRQRAERSAGSGGCMPPLVPTRAGVITANVRISPRRTTSVGRRHSGIGVVSSRISSPT